MTGARSILQVILMTIRPFETDGLMARQQLARDPNNPVNRKRPYGSESESGTEIENEAQAAAAETADQGR